MQKTYRWRAVRDQGHMDENTGPENWTDFSLGLAGVRGWFLWDRSDLPIILGNTGTECPQPRLKWP